MRCCTVQRNPAATGFALPESDNVWNSEAGPDAILPAMKTIYCLALLAAAISTAAFAEDGRSTASVHWQDGVGEVVMRGAGGTSDINGEKVELKNGTVYVDGQSFGAVPKNSEIRYVVAGSSRTLYVQGKLRNQWTKK